LSSGFGKKVLVNLHKDLRKFFMLFVQFAKIRALAPANAKSGQLTAFIFSGD